MAKPKKGKRVSVKVGEYVCTECGTSWNTKLLCCAKPAIVKRKK